jgi:bifunctional DNA-binding transcriptional regulator/antitoxin component of YhaV-PrlF toxin-antitoxin module
LIECDPYWIRVLQSYYEVFGDRVSIVNQHVNPKNIIELIQSKIGLSGIDFLSIDIDSFDYHVLDAILKKYKPKIICTEINELFPPPIKFTVLPEAKTLWRGDAFQGYSLQLAIQLAEKYGYVVSELHFNNLFLEKIENTLEEVNINAEKIYYEGYIARVGRRKKFAHNKKYEILIGKKTEEIINFFNSEFKDRKNEYTIED